MALPFAEILAIGFFLPEQAMGWLYPLGLGLVILAEDKPTEFSILRSVVF